MPLSRAFPSLFKAMGRSLPWQSLKLGFSQNKLFLYFISLEVNKLLFLVPTTCLSIFCIVFPSPPPHIVTIIITLKALLDVSCRKLIQYITFFQNDESVFALPFIPLLQRPFFSLLILPPMAYISIGFVDFRKIWVGEHLALRLHWVLLFLPD